MQQYAGTYLLQVYSTYFGRPLHPSSGIHKTVTAASGTGQSNSATTFLQSGHLGHVGGRSLHRYYDLHQRLQLQFYVLLMMGAKDARNMQIKIPVIKYLHTIASCWILLIYNYYYYFVQTSTSICQSVHNPSCPNHFRYFEGTSRGKSSINCRGGVNYCIGAKLQLLYKKTRWTFIGCKKTVMYIAENVRTLHDAAARRR